MKVLVASHKLDLVGGAETFTYTLIEELSKRENLLVEYFTLKKGFVSNKIENELGVNFSSKRKYDLILANHISCVEKLFYMGFIIQTCHGIYPEQEQPSHYADGYVSISNEVKNYLESLGKKSKLIYNGINLKRYKSNIPINKTLSTVLSLCHTDRAHKKVNEACELLNVKFLKFDKYKDPVWNVEEKINESDLVVGLGRSAYEAMACGRPVVVFDDREYFESCGDGYVADNVTLSINNNCSGRFLRKQYDVKALALEFSKYSQEDGAKLRSFAKSVLDIQIKVDEYLAYHRYLNPKNKKFNLRKYAQSIWLLFTRLVKKFSF